jgi:hypothetical protein
VVQNPDVHELQGFTQASGDELVGVAGLRDPWG